MSYDCDLSLAAKNNPRLSNLHISLKTKSFVCVCVMLIFRFNLWGCVWSRFLPAASLNVWHMKLSRNVVCYIEAQLDFYYCFYYFFVFNCSHPNQIKVSEWERALVHCKAPAEKRFTSLDNPHSNSEIIFFCVFFLRKNTFDCHIQALVAAAASFRIFSAVSLCFFFLF